LLVEDEPLIALSAHDALEAGGFEPISVDDGTKALDVLTSQSGDLAGLITDVRLGSGPNGWDVARRARELKPNLPVVYTTGDSAHEWTALGVPKSVMIQKPYALAQLVTAISTLRTEDDTNAPQ
jgi:DNA-binding response OmpR family regulator